MLGVENLNRSHKSDLLRYRSAVAFRFHNAALLWMNHTLHLLPLDYTNSSSISVGQFAPILKHINFPLASPH